MNMFYYDPSTTFQIILNLLIPSVRRGCILNNVSCFGLSLAVASTIGPTLCFIYFHLCFLHCYTLCEKKIYKTRLCQFKRWTGTVPFHRTKLLDAQKEEQIVLVGQALDDVLSPAVHLGHVAA